MRKLLSVAAMLAMPVFAGDILAGEPASAAIVSNDNQVLADDLANHFRTSGKLSNYDVAIETDGGIVTLTGNLASQAQRDQVVQMTRMFPGVVAVVDHIEIARRDNLIPTNYQAAAPNPMPAAAKGGTTWGVDEPMIEPAPATSFAGGIVPYSDSPVLPPYSWPAYTPYNNFASLAYQTQYPSGAWPFIGPPHPYPMIPSGWRKVTLTWKKGYWWLKFGAHGCCH